LSLTQAVAAGSETGEATAPVFRRNLASAKRPIFTRARALNPPLGAVFQEAKALEAQGQVLRSNTSLIQRTVAKGWSGNLPVNMDGSAPLPHLPADSQQPVPASAQRQLRGRLA
jgi:hypothetical protein